MNRTPAGGGQKQPSPGPGGETAARRRAAGGGASSRRRRASYDMTSGDDVTSQVVLDTIRSNAIVSQRQAAKRWYTATTVVATAIRQRYDHSTTYRPTLRQAYVCVGWCTED